jgi:hypothetical protein
VALQGKELDVDEEYDNDGGIEMYEDRRKRGTREAQDQRSKAAQVADHRRMQSAQDRCLHCFGGQVTPPLSHISFLLSSRGCVCVCVSACMSMHIYVCVCARV